MSLSLFIFLFRYLLALMKSGSIKNFFFNRVFTAKHFLTWSRIIELILNDTDINQYYLKVVSRRCLLVRKIISSAQFFNIYFLVHIFADRFIMSFDFEYVSTIFYLFNYKSICLKHFDDSIMYHCRIYLLNKTFP